jgi:hypothetical protein
MFNIEGLETLLTTLAFISAAVSVYDAWAASPGLVMPFDQVVVDMENVRDP